MKYKYPRINNWLRFNKQSDGQYEVFDYLNEEAYVFDNQLARFAMRLDGKRNPYLISNQLSKRDVTSFLSILDKHNLLRRSSVLKASFLETYFTLWIPNKRRRNQHVTAALNLVLLVSFLPVVIVGVALFFSVAPKLTFNHSTLSFLLGYISGMVLHELAHANACLAYGGNVFEIGALSRFPFIGAYVLMNADYIKSRMKRIQIYAAGIEMNLLLTGAFLLTSCFAEAKSGFFYNMAVVNAITALCNMLLIQGLDGAKIMSNLLGVDSITEAAFQHLYKRKKRSTHSHKRLFESGCHVVFRSVLFVQLLQILFLLIDGWVIISWIL